MKGPVFYVVAIDGTKREDVAVAPQADFADTLRKDYLKAHPKADPASVIIEERVDEHHPTWSQKPQ